MELGNYFVDEHPDLSWACREPPWPDVLAAPGAGNVVFDQCVLEPSGRHGGMYIEENRGLRHRLLGDQRAVRHPQVTECTSARPRRGPQHLRRASLAPEAGRLTCASYCGIASPPQAFA
eukprot:2280188-Pyramimonas_sp.AAC.1